jgi:hypothetical protein
LIGLIEPQVGQAVQQRPDRNLGFDPGQLSANAVVNTPTERERAQVGSGNIKLLRSRWA